MRPDAILARYGEIGLKSKPVRRRFEQVLQQNIELAFEGEGVDGIISRIPGRFLITSSRPERALDVLPRIFGLTSVSPVRIVPSELDKLLPEIAKYFDEVARGRPDAKTFALRVRRAGQHPYSSQDVARKGGGAVLDRPEGARWKVNLETPDIELFIEIRDQRAYLFHERREAPGGLPVGTQGKVVVLLKDLHSVIAAWLMMKRGCNVLPVTFTGPTGNPEKARALVAILRKWYLRNDLIEVPHPETTDFPRAAACVLCMRQMIRKADHVARRKKAKGIVTGESFSSSTVENLTQFGGLAPVPILRPLLGVTPQLVNEFAQRIGIETGRATPFYEPCPFRVYGRVQEEDVRRLESELGLDVRAFNAVRTRAAPDVTP